MCVCVFIAACNLSFDTILNKYLTKLLLYNSNNYIDKMNLLKDISDTRQGFLKVLYD